MSPRRALSAVSGRCSHSSLVAQNGALGICGSCPLPCWHLEFVPKPLMKRNSKGKGKGVFSSDLLKGLTLIFTIHFFVKGVEKYFRLVNISYVVSG